MRKILFVLLALVFVAGVSFAATTTSLDNASIFGESYGPAGVTAPVEIQKVYLGSAASCAIGDVVTWNVTAQDGYTVDRCAVDYDTLAGEIVGFAGVMVTSTSRVTSASTTTPSSSGPNVGYMAVRGFCVALVDTSESKTGGKLVLNGATLAASFGTADGGGTGFTKRPSQDIGILFTDAGADSLMRVYLR